MDTLDSFLAQTKSYDMHVLLSKKFITKGNDFIAL